MQSCNVCDQKKPSWDCKFAQSTYSILDLISLERQLGMRACAMAASSCVQLSQTSWCSTLRGSTYGSSPSGCQAMNRRMSGFLIIFFWVASPDNRQHLTSLKLGSLKSTERVWRTKRLPQKLQCCRNRMNRFRQLILVSRDHASSHPESPKFVCSVYILACLKCCSSA